MSRGPKSPNPVRQITSPATVLSESDNWSSVEKGENPCLGVY